MIRYSLRCDRGHAFESWFASAGAFDALDAAGLLSCAVCGASGVRKALMAPAVGAGAVEADPVTEPPPDRPLSAPASLAEQALADLRQRIESTSDDVGPAFATEARRIHAGEAPRRAIRGEARVAEARALLEDGIPVVPLPWTDRRNRS